MYVHCNLLSETKKKDEQNIGGKIASVFFLSFFFRKVVGVVTYVVDLFAYLTAKLKIR